MCRNERNQRKHCLISSSSLKNQRGSLAQISQTEVARWAKEIGAFKIETPK
jgi:arginine repressor